MATKKTTSSNYVEQFFKRVDAFEAVFPQLAHVLGDEDSFNGLQLKVRADGTTLGILKRFAADGTPMVCFGAGYGAIGGLDALERAVAGNSWKVDKPWNPNGR